MGRLVGARSHLATTAASFKFWVADWLRVGCFVFGEKFAQAQELFPWWDEQTLMNIQRVGNRIPPSRRRAEHLPFEYHEAVAAAVPAAQIELLERAVNDPSITREVLRDMVDARRQDTPEKAEIEFRARPIRRAMSAVDACLPRLAGEPKKLVHEAGNNLREALRIVEAPGRKPK